jgi:hypothetical protein
VVLTIYGGWGVPSCPKGAIECECDEPKPDCIGECFTCHRPVFDGRTARRLGVGGGIAS